MSLIDIDFKFKYRSNSDNLYRDFYMKCIEESIKYDRAVGYFTSSTLALISQGLEKFIHKNGKIRIIANPYLTEEDLQAIELGYESKDNIILKKVLNEINITAQTIKDDVLNVLAWLISEEILDIKIAYTKNNAIYHEKFGIFYDQDGNSIAFSGSANETVGGLKNNFEKIDVYFKDFDALRVQDAINDFENLWNNRTDKLDIIEIPKVAKDKILSYKSNDKSFIKNAAYCKKEVIELRPREYQQIAIDRLKGNNWHGILEMATGTGKTITSLLAAAEYLRIENKIFLIIIVPFVHLIEQWEEDVNKIGLKNVLKCCGSKKSWLNEFNIKIRDFNIGVSNKECIITTYRTASCKEFNNIAQKIRNYSFLIADECHYFGINSLKVNSYNNFSCKVGLSATPDRWWDDIGTKRIYDYFNKVVFKYSLEEAIRNDYLSEYKYFPIIVDLCPDEIEDYQNLSKKIAYLINSNEDNEQELEKLHLKRSLIIAKAKNKKHLLFKEISKYKDEIVHTLVYCAPGEISEITKELAKQGLRVHRFDSTISMKKRIKLLQAFDETKIQILVAIKCLDEGVDVPSTKKAYFLASTSNPKEFIQRRGRILRKHNNKNISEIYDFIVLPQVSNDNLFGSIAYKEMPRFAEFSRHAINKYDARNELRLILENYNLEYLMDKLPWEIYKEKNN